MGNSSAPLVVLLNSTAICCRRSVLPALNRKTVTALFADIKGSMELMKDLDPEEARAIVDPAGS